METSNNEREATFEVTAAYILGEVHKRGLAANTIHHEVEVHTAPGKAAVVLSPVWDKNTERTELLVEIGTSKTLVRSNRRAHIAAVLDKVLSSWNSYLRAESADL